MSATTTTGRSPKQERALLDKLGLVPEEEVAGLLGVSVKTLKNRPRSNLPEYVKAGRRRLFKLASVREYLEARTVAE